MKVAPGMQGESTRQRPLLELHHVSKQFGGVKALDDVSFEVQRGGLFGVIGPNGAGKSTLFSFMILALSWNLLGGYGGQFSLGHAIFVGAGSYTFAVLLVHTAVPLYLAVPLSGVMAALIAALSGLLLLRLRAAYFSVGTLGLALAGLSWMINWSYTGGTQELSLPPSATLDYSTPYYASLGTLVLTIVCLVALVRSSFGLRLMAVRDDEDAAAELGVNSFLVKMTAFAVSAFFIGLAGALIALQNVSLDPNSAFSLNWTVNMIIMAVLGGLATTTGPLIGAVVIFALQQQLQGYGSWSTLVIGLLLKGFRFSVGMGLASILSPSWCCGPDGRKAHPY